MGDFEEINNGGALRSAGEVIGSIGLGIIVAMDAAVVKRCVQNESIDSLLPVVGAGIGAVTVGVVLMMIDQNNEN
jgi:hypothetical protein